MKYGGSQTFDYVHSPYFIKDEVLTPVLLFYTHVLLVYENVNDVNEMEILTSQNILANR